MLHIKFRCKQDKRIKELEQENQQLKEDYNIVKQSKEHFKKVAENVVDLLSTLNKELPNRQLEELNYKKCIDDTICLIKENLLLKQSQNEKAIEVLEDISYYLCDKYFTIGKDEPIEVIEIEQISSYINNKIKSLSSKRQGT